MLGLHKSETEGGSFGIGGLILQILNPTPVTVQSAADRAGALRWIFSETEAGSFFQTLNSTPHTRQRAADAAAVLGLQKSET